MPATLLLSVDLELQVALPVVCEGPDLCTSKLRPAPGFRVLHNHTPQLAPATTDLSMLESSQLGEKGQSHPHKVVNVWQESYTYPEHLETCMVVNV